MTVTKISNADGRIPQPFEKGTRMRKMVIMLLSLTLGSVNALAADTDMSCPLLERAELSLLGVTEASPFRDSGTDWAASPSELPNSHVVSAFCTVDLVTPRGRGAVILAVDRVEGKVTKEQVGDWLRAVDASQGVEAGAVVSKLGNTTCEAGQYTLPTLMGDGAIRDVGERYVACDAQVGTHHMSLNIHVPVGDFAPTMEQAKAILDKSIERYEYRAAGLRI